MCHHADGEVGGDGGCGGRAEATSRPIGERGEIGGEEAAASSGSVGDVPAVWGDVAAVLNPDVTPEVKPEVYADDDVAIAVASGGVGVTSRLATSGIGVSGTVGRSCFAVRLLFRDKLCRSDSRAEGKEGISEERGKRCAG